LVSRRVAVIVANYPAVLAAKEATASIPIVFTSAADPVKIGLVASLNQPGANVTGVHLLGGELDAKRLELLHEVVPAPAIIGVLINPRYPDADLQLRELQHAAAAIDRQIQVSHASTEAEIDLAFSALAQQGVRALLIPSDPFYTSRRGQLVTLAARYNLPAIYNQRKYAEDGGLLSYGSDFADGYRLAGTYVARILGGATPATLPVQQSTKFELVVNLKTARALGLIVPPSILARADEVIE
jgi:putative ABC transport system substrate-binding protein